MGSMKEMRGAMKEATAMRREMRGAMKEATAMRREMKEATAMRER